MGSLLCFHWWLAVGIWLNFSLFKGAFGNLVRSSYTHHYKAGAYFIPFKISQWYRFPDYNIYSSLKDGDVDDLLLGYGILNQVA